MHKHHKYILFNFHIYILKSQPCISLTSCYIFVVAGGNKSQIYTKNHEAQGGKNIENRRNDFHFI